MDQIFVAAAVAWALDVKPPSVYVAPPTLRRIVFPYVCWQVFMSALGVMSFLVKTQEKLKSTYSIWEQ